jgi:plasmid stabilization system protein ParE
MPSMEVVIVYEIDEVADQIGIIAVFHGAQNREDAT